MTEFELFLQKVNSAKSDGRKGLYLMSMNYSESTIQQIKSLFPDADVQKCKRGLWDIILKF